MGRPSLVKEHTAPGNSCQGVSRDSRSDPSVFLPEGLPADFFLNHDKTVRQLRGGSRLLLDLDRGRNRAAVRAASSDYPEDIAETDRGWLYAEDLCGKWGRVGVCTCGEKAARQIICNREWCPICGGYLKLGHRRRISAWLPKLQEISCLGYFVVTLPLECRADYRNSETLGRLGTSIKRLLKDNGFSRGLRRWHWFGEPTDVDRGDLPDAAGSPVFHPHLNALVEGGYIAPERLERLRRGLARILRVAVDRINLYYQYTTDVSKMWHWIKYVLRPTFLKREWDRDLAIALHGFRNCSTWGTWGGPVVWDSEAMEKELEGEETMSKKNREKKRRIEKGLCPCCGEPMHWLRMPVPIRDLEAQGFFHLGDGVYSFEGSPPGSVERSGAR